MGMFQTRGSNSRYGVLEASSQAVFPAAGTNQATGAQLRAPVNLVSGATGTNGVTIPKSKVPGRQLVIYSSAATNALQVYPPVGGTVNNGAVNAVFAAAARTPYIFINVADGTGLNWIVK